MKIFGREKIIESMWNSLEDKSILFTAERRMGKTEVLKAMRDENREDFVTIFQDLEKVSTPIEFVNAIVKDLNAYATKTQRLKQFSTDWLGRLGGVEIGGVVSLPEAKAPDWKNILVQIINNACENNKDKKIVFLWDELPYMLQLIDKKSNESLSLGLEIMNTLRALRMENPNLRMVLTGSIGIHHVLEEIKDDVSARPINDLDTVKLSKLKPQDAKAMAIYRLKDKERIFCSEPPGTVVSAVIEQADYIPFYIEKIVKELAKQELDAVHISSTEIEQIVNIILTDGNDSWELEHFRSRLKDYIKAILSMRQGSQLLCIKLQKQS